MTRKNLFYVETFEFQQASPSIESKWTLFKLSLHLEKNQALDSFEKSVPIVHWVSFKKSIFCAKGFSVQQYGFNKLKGVRPIKNHEEATRANTLLYTIIIDHWLSQSQMKSNATWSKSNYSMLLLSELVPYIQRLYKKAKKLKSIYEPKLGQC